MSENNKNNYSGACYAAGRELYESSVGLRAVERVGRGKCLKGTVHEILFADAYNANPVHANSQIRACLTKSTTAPRNDIVFLRSGAGKGSVAGSAQLKDTARSINTTINQVKAGHYRGTNLIGTKETVQAYEKAVANNAKRGIKVTQKMTSSGISSSDTQRIAAKTIGTTAGKLNAQAVAKVAGSAGLTGAAISGAIEIVSAGKDWANGEIDGGDFTGRVVKETVGGGISAAAGSSAASVVAVKAATWLAATAAPAWAPAAIGLGVAVAVGTFAKKLWDGIWD